MKQLSIYSAAMVVITTVGTAYALNNDGNRIRSVEAIKDNTVYLHLQNKMKDKPACAKFEALIACSLKDAYCSEAVRVALGARMSDSAIDFEVTETCVGNVARFSRLRF